MKDNTRDNKQNAYDEGQSISNLREASTGMSFSFSIDKFPKEFKKGFFRTLDKRFLAILILSFIVNISLLLYLEKIVPKEIDSKTITKIQKQYAKLLLEGTDRTMVRPDDIINADYKLDAQMITGLTKWMNDFTADIFESLNKLPAMEEADKIKETRGYSKEEMSLRRKTTAQQRLSSRSDLEREMGKVGLLGLISSQGKNVDYGYVQDLLEYASKNSDHLVSVLSKLSKIEVPRYGSTGYLRRIQGFDDNKGNMVALKGGRKSADKEVNNLMENMAQLAKPKTETITRNVQFEEVRSSYLGKLAGDTGIKKERTARDVIRIVRSHARALQDCYKQELKREPNLKGKIVVRFTINPEGAVIHASMVSSTLNNPRMENCILTRIRRWRNFPPCDPSFGNKTYRQSFKFGE